MTRKEALKYFKHLALLMIFALPVLVLLNLFVFEPANISGGLQIFLDVVIGLIIVIIVEMIIRKIKKNKEEKRKRFEEQLKLKAKEEKKRKMAERNNKTNQQLSNLGKNEDTKDKVINISEANIEINNIETKEDK